MIAAMPVSGRMMKIIEALRVMESLRHILLVGIIFAPVEWLFALRPSSTFRSHRLTDLAYGMLNAIIMRAPLIAVLVIGSNASDMLLPAGFRHWVIAQPLALQVFEAMLIGDLGLYSAHRLLHSRLLWPFHAIHHSAEHIDWLVAFRVHPIELLLTTSMSLLPVLIMGFSPIAIGLYFVSYEWMSLLNHANVKFTFGPLRYIIVGTEFHHWHHANEQVAYDKNFAAQVVLWDWLFGTLHLPRGRRPASYGVNEEMPSGLVDQLFHPFRRRNRREDSAPVEPMVGQALPVSGNI
jgi:sterol desaturase/sphingolipid hydroxylase (fatty acid hydroxylase superfamily)